MKIPVQTLSFYNEADALEVMEPEAPERGPEGATTIKSAIGLNTFISS